MTLKLKYLLPLNLRDQLNPLKYGQTWSRSRAVSLGIYRYAERGPREPITSSSEKSVRYFLVFALIDLSPRLYTRRRAPVTVFPSVPPHVTLARILSSEITSVFTSPLNRGCGYVDVATINGRQKEAIRFTRLFALAHLRAFDYPISERENFVADRAFLLYRVTISGSRSFARFYRESGAVRGTVKRHNGVGKGEGRKAAV